MPTSIIMCGAAGRMGQMIMRCAVDDPEFDVLAGVDAPDSPEAGSQVGALIGRPEITALVCGGFSEAVPRNDQAAVIDFSSPDATMEQIAWARQHEIPSVIGTTGLEKRHVAELQTAAETLPVVFAPNMSVGVNLLFKVAGEVARILGAEYDVEITEMHHRFKKDAPSGTARRLGEVVAEAMGGSYDELVQDGRSGMTGERPARQIGMHALRGGDVVGDHTVTFATLGERIELTHRAHSRETFARGALRAAAWVRDQKPGLYDMADVLGMK